MAVTVRVIRVNLDEFELSDRRVYLIDPPLTEKMDVEEFQKIYERSAAFIRGCGGPRCDDADTPRMGS